jgi:hypothetical protein
MNKKEARTSSNRVAGVKNVLINMQLSVSLSDFRVILVVVALYVYSIFLNVQMNWKRAVLLDELYKLQSEKEVLISQKSILKAKTIATISENENLQLLLINLEKVAHNQKLAVLVIGLFILATVALVTIDVINKTSPDIPASFSNIADVGQAGIVAILDERTETLKAVDKLQTLIAQNNDYIQDLIVSTENLTDEISIISAKMVVFQNAVQPLLGVSLYLF